MSHDLGQQEAFLQVKCNNSKGDNETSEVHHHLSGHGIKMQREHLGGME